MDPQNSYELAWESLEDYYYVIELPFTTEDLRWKLSDIIEVAKAEVKYQDDDVDTTNLSQAIEGGEEVLDNENSTKDELQTAYNQIKEELDAIN
ncbi:hypothetical protein [Alteribacillus sp. YIM 98480]|uniref:hypothetical protein n=1 Tax=Alteribacillus sp. YIM 98480 TaxID=2606599 RepID=UPI00131CE88B|nr:hypothetical protein [Alteribacillus sp. YIM 98480]